MEDKTTYVSPPTTSVLNFTVELMSRINELRNNKIIDIVVQNSETIYRPRIDRGESSHYVLDTPIGTKYNTEDDRTSKAKCNVVKNIFTRLGFKVNGGCNLPIEKRKLTLDNDTFTIIDYPEDP